MSARAPLSVWCVSDGRAGIARQCSAVANALSELVAVDVREVTLTPKAPQVWLPPQFWPAPLAALPEAQRALLTPPWPDVWIANGRRSIAFSLWLKGQSNTKSLVVQLQDPRIDPARFDLVVPPRHDRVTGANVVETLGAPVWFTQAQIEAAVARHPVAPNDQGKTVIVILGGSSKRHRFEPARAYEIIYDLKKLMAKGVKLLITTSRRTPAGVVQWFREFATSSPEVSFFENEALDGPNPYLAWLAQADSAMVTEDSTNMMTDAAFFGLPIHLIKFVGGDERFDRLHAGFFEAGAARWFDGELEDWRYAPIRDARVVAEGILARVGARQG